MCPPLCLNCVCGDRTECANNDITAVVKEMHDVVEVSACGAPPSCKFQNVHRRPVGAHESWASSNVQSAGRTAVFTQNQHLLVQSCVLGHQRDPVLNACYGFENLV